MPKASGAHSCETKKKNYFQVIKLFTRLSLNETDFPEKIELFSLLVKALTFNMNRQN